MVFIRRACDEHALYSDTHRQTRSVDVYSNLVALVLPLLGPRDVKAFLLGVTFDVSRLAWRNLASKEPSKPQISPCTRSSLSLHSGPLASTQRQASCLLLRDQMTTAYLTATEIRYQTPTVSTGNWEERYRVDSAVRTSILSHCIFVADWGFVVSN